MDLYLIGSKYVGTQADARGEAKAQGVRFDPDRHSIKVPTDKAGLIAYLNERQPLPAAAHMASVSAAVAGPPPAAAERPFSAKSVLARMDQPPPLDRSQRLTVLEEAIQNSDGFELSSLLGNVISRLEELRREARLNAA